MPAATHTALSGTQRRFGRLPGRRLPVVIKRCHLQEFSDEDVEEDIDALMSAHSKPVGRRLSNAASTVPPPPSPLQTEISENRNLENPVCTHWSLMCCTLTVSWRMRRGCPIVDCVNTAGAASQGDCRCHEHLPGTTHFEKC